MKQEWLPQKLPANQLFLDFTGFGWVNCRKMEASVWTDSQVAEKISKEYILISLYVDDKTSTGGAYGHKWKTNKATLRTIGDKWSTCKRSKFGANAQPFYVPVDNEGNPLNGSYSYKEDIPEYTAFLQKGLDKYRNAR